MVASRLLNVMGKGHERWTISRAETLNTPKSRKPDNPNTSGRLSAGVV